MSETDVDTAKMLARANMIIEQKDVELEGYRQEVTGLRHDGESNRKEIDYQRNVMQ